MNNPIVDYVSNMLPTIKANPMQILMQRRFNIPNGFPMNDPDAIINYLLQSRQVSQQQINNIYQMAQQQFNR